MRPFPSEPPLFWTIFSVKSDQTSRKFPTMGLAFVMVGGTDPGRIQPSLVIRGTDLIIAEVKCDQQSLSGMSMRTKGMKRRK